MTTWFAAFDGKVAEGEWAYLPSNGVVMKEREQRGRGVEERERGDAAIQEGDVEAVRGRSRFKETQEDTYATPSLFLITQP